MKTSYFTFGQDHIHSYEGKTVDRETVVKITAENPRSRMVELFGTKWAFEYSDIADLRMEYYPGGILTID